MENINHILDMLKKKEARYTEEFFIPEAWNSIGYDRYRKDGTREGEICINPYDYGIFCIEEHILSRASAQKGFSEGKNESGQHDMTRSTIYGMLPRMLTAWEHHEKGTICYGTFLKAIWLLPHLKRLNVDLIYLLPVFEYSDLYKKGELGSPYAIKNIYRLDHNMHDPLLGGYSEGLLDIEFKAFIEACHILGIRVMVDFVFRTVARDNDLIFDHPDWFYWIDAKDKEQFAAPDIKTGKKLVNLNDKNLVQLYKSPEIPEYLKKFSLPPNEIDPKRWLDIRKRREGGKVSLLDEIEKEYGITTVPGFSNVLNDPQPPWTDVTFLKFYFDNHEQAKKYIPHHQPPYILQDGICLNLYRGSEVNRELWDYVSGVIPYYQEKFNIDGARIDMGHALPPELNVQIVEKAKAANPRFILWSEIFNPEEAETAKEDGFHFISGSIFLDYKKLEDTDFNKKLFKDTLLKSALPVTAAMETPDTPRAAYVYEDRRKLELILFLNSFIPNAVPFINNGFEAMEVQPMNLGLDNTEEGRFVLEESDPLYGKLAFFDKYCIHWLNGERKWIQSLLLKTADMRRDFLDLISRKELFIDGSHVMDNKKITFIGYFDPKKERYVFLLVNRSMSTKARLKKELCAFFPERVRCRLEEMKLLYQSPLKENQSSWKHKKVLEPGEILVGFLE